MSTHAHLPQQPRANLSRSVTIQHEGKPCLQPPHRCWCLASMNSAPTCAIPEQVPARLRLHILAPQSLEHTRQLLSVACQQVTNAHRLLQLAAVGGGGGCSRGEGRRGVSAYVSWMQGRRLDKQAGRLAGSGQQAARRLYTGLHCLRHGIAIRRLQRTCAIDSLHHSHCSNKHMHCPHHPAPSSHSLRRSPAGPPPSPLCSM